MKNLAAVLTLTLASAAAQGALLPGDAARGKAVHDKHCTACHDTSVYSRPDRKMKSVEALIGRVNGCVNQTGVKLGKDEINDLVNYLDTLFYKFP